MLPPTDVYSILVENSTDKPHTVKVQYKYFDNAPEEVKVAVPAKGSAKAEQKTKQEGPTVFTYVINKVEVEGHSSAVLNAPMPSVTGPTKDYKITIGESNGAVTLTH